MKSRENTTDGSRWIVQGLPTNLRQTNFDAPRTNLSSTAQLHSRRVKVRRERLLCRLDMNHPPTAVGVFWLISGTNILCGERAKTVDY